MNKVTLILITIVYAASIVIISVFGMKAYVLNEKVLVQKVYCINESNEEMGTTITEDANGKKIINVKYTTPGDPETLTGTLLQLEWRVMPDNATIKDVIFESNEDLTRVTFHTDGSGRRTGLMFFTGKCLINLKIRTSDSTRVYADVVIWVK